MLKIETVSTPRQPPMKLKAEYLGPVLSLDGELSKYPQNLVFARNGVGKSFLSRALRHLDLHGQGISMDQAPENLVSEESPNGGGSFSLLRGTSVKANLHLTQSAGDSKAQTPDTIVHVFSEDFVQDELRQHQYEIDGKIQNQIAVDSENIGIKDAKAAIEDARVREESAMQRLQAKFLQEKENELSKKASINRQLREYKQLSFDENVLKLAHCPRRPDPSFSKILSDLDKLRALPSEPEYPATINLISIEDIDLVALTNSLTKTTSLSSVSEMIKERIVANHDFYKKGASLVRDENLANCPLCQQDITAPEPKSIIDAYIAYFADEEEKHKSELRAFDQCLSQVEETLQDLEQSIDKQRFRYNALKVLVPSVRDTEIDDCRTQLEVVTRVVSSYRINISKKSSDLSAGCRLPHGDLLKVIADANQRLEANNTISNNLKRAVEKSDEERKSLQRDACSVFGDEFAIQNWGEVEELRNLQRTSEIKKHELNELERSSPSAEARTRVAETFELLLHHVFSDKYSFDRHRFVLKREDKEMTRGVHRTLSDGEKSVIAFCYFVASIHRKVQVNSDYQKLFLVFDDPVNSMSHDYVFAIVQILKYLRISGQGQVSINPSHASDSAYLQPELLILTHNSYFFNVLLTNRAVKNEAAFALQAGSESHLLVSIDRYLAPFHEQLKDVDEVAHGKPADHTTANSIRSVVEAVGRFCRPDKCDSLENFVRFLAGDEGISLKSVLFNSLSHGSYFEESPLPEDLQIACKETIAVVERYAAGQLGIIRHQGGAKS